ncbi:NAD-dependent epimerase/dehydratase family protein [Microbulbifer zhoushanensis]|uniref:NAD-dependent epimerase/dehydratase family protein n=1 Tax=Microbulbifer TaxID=48073 RepID=UPI001F018B39|nr:NAD-dependent epimerase/dehydratase family protein [Microbulbifer zhoushanensis]
MTGNRFLVTGATGMVGSALVSRLRTSGKSVIAVGGTAKTDAEADYYWGLGDRMGGALADVHTVIHLAARVHVRGRGFSDRVGFNRDNAESTLELAKEAHSQGVKRFVFASSIGVLGASSSSAVDESRALSPHNAYTLSKGLAEEKLEAFARSAGMQLIILRFPAVIGPGVKGNVESLIRAIKLRVPLPFSKINNQRQFITLKNLVDGIALASHHGEAAGETFHLANPERVSTLELCEIIAHELGVGLRSWPVPARLLRAGFLAVGRKSLADALTADMLVDTSKVSNMLGWRAEQSLQLGLREVVTRSI